MRREREKERQRESEFSRECVLRVREQTSESCGCESWLLLFLDNDNSEPKLVRHGRDLRETKEGLFQLL
eukprot:m.261623 g.261623  ORF g.261623 m.261623 type:complete len:69 (+) comp16219_c0_seq5:120-326(+)